MALINEIEKAEHQASQAQGNLNALATRPVGRLLWEYSLPAVTGMVAMSLYNIIDRIFIGHTDAGADAISGLAITFPVMNLAAAFGVLIGAGAASRISIMLGAHRTDMAQKLLGNALTLTLTVGIIYVGLFGWFLDDILVAFGASPKTLPHARAFLETLLPGMLLTNLTFSFNNIQRASGYPRRAMFTMLISAGLNTALAPVFVFGLDMGIRGAALATDITMLLTTVFVMVHFINRNSTLHFTRGIYRLDWEVVLSIISIGAAPALVNAAASFINFLINSSLITYGGDIAVGAAGIFSSYTQLIVMVILGLCQGMQPIVGFNYGAGNIDRLRRCFMLTVGVCTCLSIVGSAVGLFLPFWIARAFTSDSMLLNVTSHGMSIALLAFALVGLQIVSTNFLQSLGKVGTSIFLGLSRQVIFLIPLLLWLPGHYGLDGVWMSFPISDALATVVTLFIISRQLRQLSKKALA